jgi:hypothetical protein
MILIMIIIIMKVASVKPRDPLQSAANDREHPNGRQVSAVFPGKTVVGSIGNRNAENVSSNCPPAQIRQ